MTQTPAVRIRDLNSQPVHPDGKFVVYWMTAYRRLSSNFALQRAAELARTHGKPLLIIEALRLDYPWASRRMHAFVLQGMSENCNHALRYSHCYVPFVETTAGQGSGMMEWVASQATMLVTDDFPCFFLPRMINAVARRIGVKMEAVDSNGLFPMHVADTEFPTAYAFRRYLQKNLSVYLPVMPESEPLANRATLRLTAPPVELLRRWPSADVSLLNSAAGILDRLPIDQAVQVAALTGGPHAARKQLDGFLKSRLSRYAEDRNQPDEDASSGLSPYLHFGHISAHEIFQALAAQENWSLNKLADPKKTRGSRAGWWGMSENAESFLDELVTWRELGFNMCSRRRDFDRYESLPEWAQTTLRIHESDQRPVVYSFDQMRHAATHDALWNAAQFQLTTTGRMHNYLRMLWGKKILEWSETPRAALDTMLELNNRFALDGRNPNSYSGIFWVLGRYDRAWGPERPIFGKIRYMTSENTARKLHLSKYLQQFSPQ
ncbi:MAG: deoxyribodipyrimidine photolyase [Planctomycetales bacterium]|nr:deoxyribodipyrimidine photolyase [Planctomycetales bacterium]